MGRYVVKRLMSGEQILAWKSPYIQIKAALIFHPVFIKIKESDFM